MTDRIQGFIVTLDRDIRDDDIEQIETALKMVRCVANVSPVVTEYNDHMARERVKSEPREKARKAYKEIFE